MSHILEALLKLNIGYNLKDSLNFYKVPLPVLIPRNFALLIKDKIKKSIDKLNINFSDIFLEKSQLEKKGFEKPIKEHFRI